MNSKEVGQYVDFLVLANLNLEQIDRYVETGNYRYGVKVKEFLKAHALLLRRMEYEIRMSAPNKANRRRQWYDKSVDGDRELFGHTTVNDYADERYDFMIIDERMVAMMDFLYKQLIPMGLNYRLTCGYWYNDYSKNRYFFNQHKFGAACDFQVLGVGREEGYKLIKGLLKGANFAFKLVCGGNYLHLNVQGTPFDYDDVYFADRPDKISCRSYVNKVLDIP